MLLDAAECASASRWPGARRHVHAARRRRRPGASDARPRRRRREARRADLRATPPVTRLEPRVADTPLGHVNADVVVRATGGATRPSCPATSATCVPIYSLMIGTEPLPKEFWDEVGLEGRETVQRPPLPHLLRDAHRGRPHRHRRPRRAVPLRLVAERDFDARPPRVREHCDTLAARALPRRSGDCAGHAPLGRALRRPATGTPRSASTATGGMAWSGGYVGDGVSTTNLGRPHAARPHPRRRHASSRRCPGSTTAPSSGSPSRCAGSA